MLLAAIRLYRRRLSGRGPFAKIRCTFEALESCSAYGERVAAVSPSLVVALLRIRRRLRRCRHLSLYRLDGGRLGWGRDFDAALVSEESARQLDEALAQDVEGEAVREAMRCAANLVAMRPSVCNAKSAPGLLLRDASAVRRRFRKGAWMRLAVAIILILVAGVTFQYQATVAAMLLVASLASAYAAVGSRRMLRRLDWLDVLAAIEGPPPSGAPFTVDHPPTTR